MIRDLAIKIIRFYHIAISPIIGNHCRFYPSCSQYTQEAISKLGFTKGIIKGFQRVLRCHPLSPGGYDPITK